MTIMNVGHHFIDRVKKAILVPAMAPGKSQNFKLFGSD